MTSEARPGHPDGAPPAYEWPAGKSAAAVVSVDFDGPTPYLWASRNSPKQLMGELEQRRFGPRQGVWRILALLERLQIPATFYVPGAIAEAHPAAMRTIVAGGHEIAMHGYLHERLDDLTPDEVGDILDRSMQALAAAGAAPPFGYRSPSWEMTPGAWEKLRTAGVRYDSSLMGHDHPYWLDGLVEVPVQWQLDDAIFYRYVHGSTRAPVPASVVMDDWVREVDAIGRFGGLAMLTVHPWLSGRAGRLVAFEEMLRRAGDHDGMWWATAAEVADHHRGRYQESDGSGTTEL